jgi:transcriptional regulator NrdR family protein
MMSKRSTGFKCPQCDGQLRVHDSRPIATLFNNHHVIRRRRKCMNCTYRVSTYECVGNPQHEMHLLRQMMTRLNRVKQELDLVHRELRNMLTDIEKDGLGES